MPHVFETKDKSGKPHPKKRFQYKDWTGRKRTATGTTSWKETRRLAQKIQDENDLIRKGYLPPPNKSKKHAVRAFDDVKNEYLAWGESQGGKNGRPWGDEHARKRRAQLGWWESSLSLSRLEDVQGILPKVEQLLRDLQASGKSGKTLASYGETISAFCNWCAHPSREYLSSNPVDGLAKFDTTPQVIRRLLTAIEIRSLLDAAPPYRHLLYGVSFCTGLRANELRNLTTHHLDVESKGLVLDAKWTKNRKRGFQPLPGFLVECLIDFMEAGGADQLYRRFFSRSAAIPGRRK